MLKETLYTSIGAYALAFDFVTQPKRSQDWLKKAERRGGKLVAQSEQRLRKLNKRTGATISDLQESVLSTIGLAERRAARAETHAVKAVKSTSRKARRRAPRARVSRRTTRVRGQRTNSTTLTVQTPAVAAN